MAEYKNTLKQGIFTLFPASLDSTIERMLLVIS